MAAETVCWLGQAQTLWSWSEAQWRQEGIFAALGSSQQCRLALRRAERGVGGRGDVGDTQASALHGDLCFLESPHNTWRHQRDQRTSTLVMTGDLMHGVGVLLVFFVVLVKQDASGLSLHSQELLLVTYLTRFLNPLLTGYPTFRSMLGMVYIVATLLAVLSMWYHPQVHRTWQREFDKLPYLLILLGCAVGAWGVAMASPFLEQVFAFSIMVEGLALAPQAYMFTRTQAYTQYAIMAFYCLGLYPLLYLLNFMLDYKMHAMCTPGVALVAAVSHLTCCAIGVLSASTPTFRVLAGALSKLRAHRRDRLGVEEPPDVALADEQPSVVLIAAAAFARVAAKAAGCFFEWLPDLEVPTSDEGREGPRQYSIYGSLSKQKAAPSEGMLNLLPFKVHVESRR